MFERRDLQHLSVIYRIHHAAAGQCEVGLACLLMQAVEHVSECFFEHQLHRLSNVVVPSFNGLFAAARQPQQFDQLAGVHVRLVVEHVIGEVTEV